MRSSPASRAASKRSSLAGADPPSRPNARCASCCWSFSTPPVVSDCWSINSSTTCCWAGSWVWKWTRDLKPGRLQQEPGPAARHTAYDAAPAPPGRLLRNKRRLLVNELDPGEFFRRMLALAQPYLSAERSRVDNTRIEPWTGQKRIQRKGDREQEAGDFRGRRRSNHTHPSATDAEARLYRKARGGSGGPAGLLGPCAGGEPSGSDRGSHGHHRRRYRRGRCRAARGLRAQAPKATRGDAGGRPNLSWADLVKTLRELGAMVHAAQGSRASALDRRSTRHGGYQFSPRRRPLVEDVCVAEVGGGTEAGEVARAGQGEPAGEVCGGGLQSPAPVQAAASSGARAREQPRRSAAKGPGRVAADRPDGRTTRPLRSRRHLISCDRVTHRFARTPWFNRPLTSRGRPCQAIPNPGYLGRWGVSSFPLQELSSNWEMRLTPYSLLRRQLCLTSLVRLFTAASARSSR